MLSRIAWKLKAVVRSFSAGWGGGVSTFLTGMRYHEREKISILGLFGNFFTGGSPTLFGLGCSQWSNYPSRSCNGLNGLKGPKFK